MIILPANTKLEIHPLANEFPMINKDEFARLKEDIQNNGQKTPIKLYQGCILDGRNRYRACQSLNLEIIVEDLPEGTDIQSLVKSENLYRRHLSESQRATCATSYIDRVPADFKGAKRDWAAKEFSVSPRLVQMAIQLKNRDSEAFQKVFNGELSLNAAVSKPKKKHRKLLSHNDFIFQLLSQVDNMEWLENLMKKVAPGDMGKVATRLRELKTAPLQEAARKLPLHTVTKTSEIILVPEDFQLPLF